MKEFECDWCGETFKSKEGFVRHLEFELLDVEAVLSRCELERSNILQKIEEVEKK